MSDQSIVQRAIVLRNQPKSVAYGLEHFIADHGIAPGEEAVFITAGIFPGKRGRQEDCAFYAVIHRRYGIWTHLYRVVPTDPIHGFVVYLEKVFEGDAVKQASDWCRAAFVGCGRIMDAQDVSA
jgi:hypothetical protein